MNSVWDILSVAIGVSFVFLILSILNSWVQENISNLFGLRTRNLANVLQNMLEPDAKKLNGLLKVKKPYSDSYGDVRLLSGLEDTAKKVLNRNERYYPIENNLNILEQPARASTKLDKLGSNAIIESKDELENDEGIWIKFQFKGEDAWLPREKLKVVEKYRPVVDKVNVREEPSMNAVYLGAKNSSDVIESIGELENYEGVWIKILFKGDENEKEQEAWLNKEYLKKQEKAKLSGRMDDLASSLFGANNIEQWERGARNVIDKLKDNPVRFFYEHPIVHSLSKPGQLPDHLPNKDFAVALLDALDDAGRQTGKTKTSDAIDIENIKKGIHQLDNTLADRLRSLLYTAQLHSKNGQADLMSFQTAVTEWFDDTVKRGQVWYKSKMQFLGIVSGLLLAILLNADTIGLSNALWHNAALRESVSQAAVAYAEQGDTSNAEEAKEQLLNLGLPIGWSFEFADHDPTTSDDPRDFPSTTGGWIAKVIGLVLTGFAISQGSQLWFDLMNRLINLRSSGFKSESEEKEPAKA